MPFYVRGTGNQWDVVEINDLMIGEIGTAAQVDWKLTFSFSSNLGYTRH